MAAPGGITRSHTLPAALLIALVALVFLPCAAAAQRPGNPVCLKPGEPTPEIYGPTDIGATLANERLSVAVNEEGTLSVFRWPSRSYWEQLKYFTTDRDTPELGLNPNEGAFSGLALVLEDGSREMLWLRDMRTQQRYASPDSDTVLTTFRSPRHRLTVELRDVVPRRGDVLIRRHTLDIGRRSDVRSVRLIAFANLNPTASRLPLLPVKDWCLEVDGSDRARYLAADDALLFSISELDLASATRNSVAVAIGANVPSDGHQVGADTYTGVVTATRAPSAYDDAADGRLSGDGSLGPTEVDSALSYPLGRRPVKLVFAAGGDPATARANLERFRDRNVLRAQRRKRNAYRHWLRDAPLPRAAPRPVDRLARRALVSLDQAIDRNAGVKGEDVAIVASLATQSPYYVDWIRDGAFFNEALDVIGHHGLVRRHNAFYAETQHTPTEGALPGTPLTGCLGPTPSGNWFMTNTADGLDAGTFPWEIDEAGFGLWAMWRHYEYLRREGRGLGYLRSVFPTIRNTAEFLVGFRDAATGLTPSGACEDDNLPKDGQPTMHASGPVLLAMRSAEAAARTLGRDATAARYGVRRAELERGIDRRYRPDGPDGAWTRDFGDGGWALWPVRVRPYSDRRARAQADVVWRSVAPHFGAPEGGPARGQYEIKALHGMAHAYRHVERRKMSRVRRGLRWIAGVQAATRGTGILGESWLVRDGELLSTVAQPHVWEQVLFYLTALEAYGREPFEPRG